jgi:phosphoenolpyruvate synthase/pyruvate phosphate dikinase
LPCLNSAYCAGDGKLEVAGGIFTVYPTIGCSNEILIDACWGLGETVVSRQELDDLFLLDKANLSIKSSTIANKTTYDCF